MATSNAHTVADYLLELPPGRADVVSDIRDLVNDHIPPGYEEGMLYGMITWFVPASVYPDTYNGKPLAYISLAAQRNYYSLYLMGVYADSEEERRFRDRWLARGGKLNMGKSCLRFTDPATLHVDLLAEVIASVPVDEFVATTKAARSNRR